MKLNFMIIPSKWYMYNTIIILCAITMNNAQSNKTHNILNHGIIKNMANCFSNEEFTDYHSQSIRLPLV